jgi:hypothetical protein
MTRHIKENEQGKEAEVVRLRTPPRKIWIDLMTGTICDPEPIEHAGQVIPFTAPRSGSRGKDQSRNVFQSAHPLEKLWPRRHLNLASKGGRYDL